MKTLKCDMTEICADVVTHIDEKGFIYCKHHGEVRKYSHRCRKLTPQELKTIKAGLQLRSYDSEEAR